MRLAFASVPLLALAACQTAGDRSSTGQCPTGEVCSPKTPKGLDFRGPDYADDWIADATIKPTAVGGTQTITIINAQDQQSLTLPYVAKLDTTALTAEAPSGAQLTLDGVANGSAYLRILDAADGTSLFDKTQVTASPVASADLVAFHDEELLASDPPPAIMMGTTVQLLAQLWDASGVHRVVDQSLVIAVTGQQTTRTTWDTVQFTPTAVGTIGASVHAGGLDRPGSVVVVDTIDGLVPGYTSFDTANPPLANQTLVACIEAQKSGAPVVGLDWSMTIAGADSSQAWVAKNCLAFTRATAGTVTLHADAGGASQDFQINVGAAHALDYVPHDPVTHGDYSTSFL
jgi:hypothetical protein